MPEIFDLIVIGGVCLNEGCISSKALLNSAKTYEHALRPPRSSYHCYAFVKFHPKGLTFPAKMLKYTQLV